MIIAIIFGVLGMLISWRLKSKFKTYSETALQSNLSGQEIAERMLADHGIRDVRVITVEGQLTRRRRRFLRTNADMLFNMPKHTASYSSEVPWYRC
jgi:Zn-dependent membrane protease YugP